MANRLLFFMILFVLNVFGQETVNLSGTVKNKNGDLLQNAIITLEGKGVSVSSSFDGKYNITVLPVVNKSALIRKSEITVNKNLMQLDIQEKMPLNIDLYNLEGRHLLTVVNKVLFKGKYQYTLPLNNVSGNIFLFKIVAGSKINVFRNVIIGNTMQKMIITNESSRLSASAMQSSTDTLRASKAGFQTARIPLSTVDGVINIVLDSLKTGNTGTGAIEDGSADRIKQYGTAQFFWGTLKNGNEEPIVKIINAVSPDVVDIEVIFNPHFVDNTYGDGSIGWPHRRGHTFRDLYVSDHVELTVTNGDGDSVFHGRIDLLSATDKVQSGYACLGPFGGEGVIYKGNSSSVVSFGSSLDENINTYGYKLFENSPSTDSTFKVNGSFPYWQYYCIYRLTLDRNAFGESGYGQVRMTSVHASPSKDGVETVKVTQKDGPESGSIYDPFRFLPPFFYVPNDTSHITPPDTSESGVD